MRRILLIGLILLLSMVVAKADPGNFPRLALDPNVLVAEGGYSNHPSDPGGVTLNGVIQRVYDTDRDARGLPRRPLTKAMLGTKEWISERNSIYERRYWDPCGGAILPRGVDFAVFTMCVNAGITRGWSMLMRVLSLPTARPYASHADTLAAIKRIGPRNVILLYGDERKRFYRGLASSRPSMGVFLNGWLNREGRERIAALNMERGITRGSGAMIAPSNLPMGKAVEDADELLEVMP